MKIGVQAQLYIRSFYHEQALRYSPALKDICMQWS